MNDKEVIKTSKFLSLVLRHKPEEIGIKLDENGWADAAELMRRMRIDRDHLNEVVATNNKKRFEFNETGSKIRACQGHSVEVDLKLEAKTPPEILYHGTNDRSLEFIKHTKMISKMSRNHVHLSQDVETASKVGNRHGGKTYILSINAHQMANEGHMFWLSANGVWLTTEVPYKYVSEIKLVNKVS